MESLPFDCSFEILAKLDFEDLTYIAVSSRKLRFVARHVFCHMHRKVIAGMDISFMELSQFGDLMRHFRTDLPIESITKYCPNVLWLKHPSAIELPRLPYDPNPPILHQLTAFTYSEQNTPVRVMNAFSRLVYLTIDRDID